MNSVFPNTTRRIKLGVWGLGRGMHLVKAAAACNLDIVAGCDFNPHFLETFRKGIPHGRFTDNAEEFLSWDFDAVLLATFCPAHGPHSVQCLEAGKHVLAEVTAFHTVAEGVALVEAAERSGKVYQLAENYPFSPPNRYLAQAWQTGLFGELVYGEYAYNHDCRQYAYIYIDDSPVQPGYTVHSWRSWLPWHYYCTHSLGPVMVITGERPLRVTTLPGRVPVPGHLPTSQGLKGMAPSILEMTNGSLVRNLVGGCTSDGDHQRLYGTKGSSEILNGQLSLRLGGRGLSPMLAINPPEDAISRVAAETGHYGGDFWVLYHFANQILHGVEPPFDVYRAADVTLPGIQAFRSASDGGGAIEVPDLRDPIVRDRYRHDHFAPARYDAKGGVFPASANRAIVNDFTSAMKDLLRVADRWQAFAAWIEVSADVVEPAELEKIAAQWDEVLPQLPEVVARARRILAEAPQSDGATVLREQLARLDLELLESPDRDARLARMRQRIENALRAKALATKHPQFEMERVGFDGLPPLELPEGYTLRTALPGNGDAEPWCRVIGESFEESLGPGDWRGRMVERDDYAPDRILFVCDPQGEPVATAAAYGGLLTGYVHYVGTAPAATGKRLGYWVSLAVLHLFAERGCERARLHTDDFRLPAIKTYWRLGFRPRITHDSHPHRWRKVAETLGIPELAANWIEAREKLS